MRSLCLFLAFTLPVPLFAQDLVAKTDALSASDSQKAFVLPEGFKMQLVASEPQIDKPMQMCFDGKGRLWITTSRHYPWAAEWGKGSDKLFILSDFDVNGNAKKIEVFDDKLNIPIGVLPLPDGKSVIVSECGKILKLTDTKGTGKADLREVLFEGFGFRDTHGMTNSFTLLPDGWVYACHGYLNDSTVKGKDGHEVKMNSGNTFRFKTDGSRIEVFTRGQVNPFGMCVDPWLNLYTADCHSRPMTQLIRGAHYDSFGKPHDGLGYAPHVINHMHGSTGLCGLVYYAAELFPKEWNGVMFVGNCVTNRINCDKIEWKGATPVGKEMPDFVSTTDSWFRPVDLKLGPDGALYVADFYNKIIGHYEVDLKHPGRDKDHGRIWRIVYSGTKGEPGVSAPGGSRNDFSKATDDELIKDFGDPNITVRLLAANEAVGRKEFNPKGEWLVDPKSKISTTSAPGGLLAMVAERQGKMNAQGYGVAIEVAKKNETKPKPDEFSGLVVRALTSKKDWGAEERKLALECFTTFDSIRVKRAVIDGMTAHPHGDFVKPLLEYAPKIGTEDFAMKQAAKIALRNCLEAMPGEELALEALNPRKPDGYFNAEIEALLGSTDARAIGRLAKLLVGGYVNESLSFETARRIARYGPPTHWEKWYGHLGNQKKGRFSKAGLQATSGFFRGLQESGFKAGPKAPTPLVGTILEETMTLLQGAVGGAEVELFGPALNAYREVRPIALQFVGTPHFDFRKLPGAIFDDPRAKLEQKIAAAEIVLAYGAPGGRDALQQFFRDSTPNSAESLGWLNLLMANSPTTTDCGLAATAIKTAPYSVALSLGTALAGDKFGAELLLTSIKSGEAPARLMQEKAIVEKLKASKVPDLDAKLKALTKNLPAPEKRLDDLIKVRRESFPKAKTDLALGKAAFTKNCAICHQLNNEGAKVGPQLDGLGIRGLDRLLEDTLDPNRNVDQAFRATKFDLKDGQSILGLLLREEGAIYVVADTNGKELRIAKADVDQKTTQATSAMPANIDALMKEDEYFHLLSFLLEQKPKK